MNKLHTKLTQKYQLYHNWHQTKHHNKVHWGVFGVYVLFVFPLIFNFVYDAAGNESGQSVVVSAITQQQPEGCSSEINNNAFCSPPPLPLPTAGNTFLDPNFGTEIIRVTDANDGENAYVSYSYWNLFNSDTSRFVINIDLLPGVQDNTAYLYNFDKATDMVTKIGPLFPSGNTNPKLRFEGLIWSAKDPDILYGIKDGSASIYKYNVSSKQYSLIKDFSSIWPNTNFSQLSMDENDNIFAFLIKENVTYKKLGVGVYDIAKDTYYRFDTPPGADYIDEGQVDKSGQWVQIELFPQSAGRIVWNLLSDQKTIIADNAIEHAPGHYDQGYGRIIGADRWASQGYTYTIRNNDNPENYTTVFSGNNWGVSSHISWRNNDELYAYSSNYTSDKLTDTYLENEIIQVFLDGSGRYRRLAHHHSVYTSYSDSPRAAVDRLGEYIIFNSNWDNSGRYDVFILKIPEQFQAPIVDIIPPLIPQNPTATPISSTQINLSWTASTDNVGVAGYKIYRDGVLVTRSQGHNVTSYSDTNLAPNTTYSYAVSSYDAAGNESAQSAPVSATTQAPSSSCDTSLGNSAICLKPAPPALPLAGESYTDSVFGTTIYRVTDPSIATNGASTNSSAQDSMWNKDGTLFYLHHTNAGTFLYSLDRATNIVTNLGAIPNTGAPDYYNLSFDGAPWNSGDANTFYGIVPSTQKRQLWQYTVTSKSPLIFAKTLLHDFSVEVPTGGYPYSRVHISPDSRYFAVTISTTGGQDTFDYVVVWDKQAGTSVILNTMSRFGKKLHSLDGFDGIYLLLQVSDYSIRYIWNWTTDTLSDPLGNGSPDCFGGHVITHAGGVISPGCSGGSWIDRSYATPHTFTPIFSWPKKDNKIDWFNDSHSSRLYGSNPLFFAQSRYVTMFFWGTFNLHSGSIYKLADYKAASLDFDTPEFFRYKGLFLEKVSAIPAVPNQWYYDTVSDTVYVWLPDSSDPQLSRTKIAIFDWRPLMEEIVQPIKQNDGVWSWRRLAHHRMNYDGTFSTSPLANMDPTGSYILFNSNWDGTLGNTDGSFREDVFMLLVPPLATTPDTTSPSTPASLTATALSSSQINLSWTASTDDVGVAGYKIYRDGALVTSIQSPVASYSDTGLTPNTTYIYTVSAHDAAGNDSSQSTPLSVTTLAAYNPSDLNQDGKTDQLDFNILKQDFNRTDKPISDLNQDSIVDSRDLGILMSQWTR